MRLPYAPTSAPDNNVEDSAIYERIKARRAPRPLLPLDLALLHSPPVADGWNSFLGAIRTKTTLSQRYLELAICRIAVLNCAGFEWRSHCPLAVKAGVSPEVMQIVRDTGYPANWFDEEGLGKLQDREQVVLAYTDAMTREVRVSEKVFSRIKGMFEERHVVELTAAISAYNCVRDFSLRSMLAK